MDARASVAGSTEETAGPTPAVLVNSKSGCSGVLIHEQFVLTAAHCLTDPSALKPMAPPAQTRNQIIASTEVSLPATDTQPALTFQIQDFRIPEFSRFADPDFNNLTRSSIGESDIALLKLNSAAPRSWPLASLPGFNPDVFSRTREPLDALMFGATELKQNDTGILRRASLMFSSRETTGEFYARAHPTMPQSGICEGDSGGGLFYKGNSGSAFVLLGIASRVVDASKCSGSIGILSDVRFFRDWIKKSMIQMGSGN
jgi:secreted trypsin-like serine protease